MSSLAASAIRFVPEPRGYWLGDRRLPSVTEILHATGVSVDFEELGAISDRLRDQIEYRRALGTAVHSDIHAFDDGLLDWSTVDARVRPYIEAWRVFRENTGLEPLERERIVFDPALEYVGTFDGIFRRRSSGAVVLIDVKLGDPRDAAAHLQTAGYATAYSYGEGALTIDERYAVQLAPTAKVPYRLTPYDDFSDFGKWRSVVVTYYEQACRRLHRGR